MALRIEDYALIGDTQTAALVGLDGSIDWLCLPKFDSPACFAALLGDPGHGRWRLGPRGPVRKTTRRYRGQTLVLETEFTTDSGVIRIVDCMPPRQREPDLVRVVEGVAGEVDVDMELVIRFDYGAVVPWVRTIDGVLTAIGGPDALSLWSPVETVGIDFTTRASFRVREGDRVPFLLAWHPSHEPAGQPIDTSAAVEGTCEWWEHWSSRSTYEGAWKEAVDRSLVVLKAMTFEPTGGVVAAPTTSLPEHIGGVRNWDYRYCWLRDASFTLYALVAAGYTTEAAAWQAWLLRAVAGDPGALQIMYGPAGERRLTELEIPWLPGYEGSRPVRVGNGAVDQLQLDVYGEVMAAMFVAARAGVDNDPAAWELACVLVGFLEDAWRQPDEGIWEVRGPRRHFTHSKVMAWVAFDRAIRMRERFGLDGPLDRWRHLRTEIHREVCERGFDATRGTFTQFYGSQELDASLLLLPLVGFLPHTDPRVLGTVAAIERELLRDGLVLRYQTGTDTVHIDGLPPGEGAFLPCTFWLADNYALQGRRPEAIALFERLLSLRNDVGLLAEEYDPAAKRLLGNFPQAFSHVALVNTALILARTEPKPDDRRAAGASPPVG
jgi:GH15 family glucan-1,4-alpha-glucosidase